MTDIARLRFQSIQNPSESGTLFLSDDGTFRVEPSPAFRDAIADLETAALARSHAYGIRLGLAFVLLGALLMILGWWTGRRGGALGETFSQPRPVEDVTLTRDGGGVQIQLHGAGTGLGKTQLAWHSNEVLQAEADEFAAKLKDMKES